MKTFIMFATATRIGLKAIRLRLGQIVFSRAILVALAMFIICTLATKSASADVTGSGPSGSWSQATISVDPPCGPLGEILIDNMETVGDWHVGTGGGAICGTPTTAPGYNGQAIKLDCGLGTTLGAYGQLRRDFPTLNLSGGDHLRFFYRGTMTNTLEVGLTSAPPDTSNVTFAQSEPESFKPMDF